MPRRKIASSPRPDTEALEREIAKRRHALAFLGTVSLAEKLRLEGEIAGLEEQILDLAPVRQLKLF